MVYLIFFAIIALKELKIMKFTLSPEFTIVSLSDIASFLLLVFTSMLIGSKVNGSYGAHKDILLALKKKLFLTKVALQYKGFALINRSDGLYAKGSTVIDIVEQLDKSYTMLNDGQKVELLDTLCDTIDTIIGDLDNESHRRPIKYVFFAANTENIMAFGTMLLTMVFAIVNKRLNLI
jgi:hypothetical protein